MRLVSDMYDLRVLVFLFVSISPSVCVCLRGVSVCLSVCVRVCPCVCPRVSQKKNTKYTCQKPVFARLKSTSAPAKPETQNSIFSVFRGKQVHLTHVGLQTCWGPASGESSNVASGTTRGLYRSGGFHCVGTPVDPFFLCFMLSILH